MVGCCPVDHYARNSNGLALSPSLLWAAAEIYSLLALGVVLLNLYKISLKLLLEPILNCF